MWDKESAVYIFTYQETHVHDKHNMILQTREK